MKMGTVPIFLAVLLTAATPAFAQEQTHRVITDPRESARPAAMQILKHLAKGEIEAAAALSNAPQRRLEVLRDFERTVGAEHFRRVFGRYFAPQNKVVLEAGIGKHRLLVWDLGEAGNHLSGQYFVEVDGRFVMDDVPSPTRTQLQRVLEAQRKNLAK